MKTSNTVHDRLITEINSAHDLKDEDFNEK